MVTNIPLNGSKQTLDLNLDPGLYHHVPDGPWLDLIPRTGGVNLDSLELLWLGVLGGIDGLVPYGDPVDVHPPLQGLGDGYGGPGSYRGAVRPVVMVYAIDC